MWTTTSQNGQKAVELAISEWKFNTGVSEDTFKKQCGRSCLRAA
jgi:outer membrane lipoprotein-sorting protein